MFIHAYNTIATVQTIRSSRHTYIVNNNRNMDLTYFKSFSKCQFSR